MKSMPNIPGFRKSFKQTAGKKIYRGRFSCPDVQWAGEGAELLATFTITAEQIADAAENRLLWTDQNVQRGIQPGVEPKPETELCLADGYPDPKKYVFDSEKADQITDKLLSGEKLFLSPLVWNLRPGHFEAYFNHADAELYVYEGKVYLPDSHHRHQAINKAVRIFRESPREFPRFSLERQFKVELYFLAREDEGNYFFAKNQLPKPTAKSKAYDLTTIDGLSLLAKRTIDKSKSLNENVNRVTDRLTASNPQVMTLSTLREMMKSFASSDEVDPPELEGLSQIAADFYELLVAVRPELGKLERPQRRKVREQLVVDAAVMMHGYAALMKDYNRDLATFGVAKAAKEWQNRLKMLSAEKEYVFRKWSGDLFDKKNPLWQALGIVKPGKDGLSLTVLNTGAARSECGRVLRQLIAAGPQVTSIDFLAKR
jgi:hypothetical protein